MSSSWSCLFRSHGATATTKMSQTSAARAQRHCTAWPSPNCPLLAPWRVCEPALRFMLYYTEMTTTASCLGWKLMDRARTDTYPMQREFLLSYAVPRRNGQYDIAPQMLQRAAPTAASRGQKSIHVHTKKYLEIATPTHVRFRRRHSRVNQRVRTVQPRSQRQVSCTTCYGQ